MCHFDRDLLEGRSADELLCELRGRQARTRKAERASLARLPAAPLEEPRASRTVLCNVPSRSIFEVLRRLQLERYGRDDRREQYATPANNATVRDNRPASFFVANLDTYAGSSGSPVFGADHLVEGLIARGEKDFVLVGDCFASLVYPDTGPLGQECTRTSEFAALVPGEGAP